MENCTIEKLLQYHYGELSGSELINVKNALLSDWTLREKYAVIQASSRRLNAFKQQVRPQAIERILQYAKASVNTI